MSAFQHYGKGIVRVAKNYTKGYSDVQSKVRDATSNDPWGPSGTQMNELAQMTYNQNDFVEIMEMLDKRLNDKGKNWRHVFKSLTVLDYLLHAGSENVVIYFRDNVYIIKTLKEFQYIDEDGKDQGANVRQKAKDISNLLSDESRLRQERRSRAHMRDRMAGGQSGSFGEGGPGAEDVENENVQRRSRSAPPRRGGRGDDDELRRAIEESKRTAAAEQAKNGGLSAEERDLQRALELSEEEERKRKAAVANADQPGLFDQGNSLINFDNPTPSTNPFPTTDTGLQSQFGLQPQYTQVQPQFTAYNPYAQQAQQEAMQAEYQRQQQQEWMRQQQELQAQQQAQLQAQQQQQQQDEWMRQQQMLQYQQQQQQLQAQQPLLTQPTGFGSNNPFAAMSMSQASSPQPSYNPPAQPQSTSPVSFNLAGTYANGGQPNLSVPSSFSPPPQSQSAPPQQQRPTRADQDHAQLASIFANRDDDGVDSFGNVGQLRYGGQVGRVGAQQTGMPGQGGHNPFAMQQQQQQQQQGMGQGQQYGSDQPFFSI